MLPPRVRQCISPAQHRLVTSNPPAIAIVLSSNTTSFPFGQQTRHCSWFNKGDKWENHLDPQYTSFLRKRHRRSKADLKHAIRRDQEWDRPMPFVRAWGARQASHWSKSGLNWQAVEAEIKKGEAAIDGKEDYELSPREKRWKRRMEAMKDYADANPYRAIFGRPFDPFWSPSMWAPLVPGWIKSETEPSILAKTETAEKKQDLSQQYAGPRTKTKTQSPAAQDASPSIKTQSFTIPVKPSKPQSKQQSYSETSSFRLSSHQRPGANPVIEASATSWNSSSDQIKRTKYDPISNRMVPVDTVESVEEPASLDKLINSFSQNFGGDKTIPDVFQAKSKSVQKPYNKDVRLSKLPKNDIDLLTADRIRASMGKQQQQTSKTNQQTKEQQAAALERDFHAKSEAFPKSLEETRQHLAIMHRHSSAQQSVVKMTKEQSSSQDKQPLVLQTALERVNANSSATVRIIQRMQNLSKRLDKLDEQTAEPATTASSESTDQHGYSTKPVGLQTAFKTEKKDSQIGERASLEHELEVQPTKNEQSSRGVGPDHEDGYSQAPTGLETSFVKETEDCAKGKQDPLEKELRPEILEKKGLVTDDGFPATPKGLQTSFSEEHRRCVNGSKSTLEEELQDQQKTAAAAEKGLAGQFEDGYVKAPVGLETAYAKEQEACAKGLKEPLEKELDAEKAQKQQAYTDHYSQSPIGLQILYSQENNASKAGEKPSLEQELKSRRTKTANIILQSEIASQRRAMLAHEGRYSTKPTVVCTSPTKEQPQRQNSTRKPIEQDLLALRGEGDVCVNVTKYTNNDKWYKQTAEHRQIIANLAKKTEESEKDRALVREINDICTKNKFSNPSSSSSTESQLKDLVDSQVHKCLQEHDEKLGRNAYKFEADGLEKELAQASVSTQPKIENIRSLSEAKPAVAPFAPAPPGRPSVAASITWAEPALYKVLAYDSGNDIISTVATPSRFAETEVPISISHALSQLYQPARFVPHFAALQAEGFHVISASRDLLVFRKVESEPKVVTNKAAISKPTDGSGIVNPIDGTRRPRPEIPTGNFASPTGFINYDSIHDPPTPPAAKATQELHHQNGGNEWDSDLDWHHYPRVRRQEPVFSGSRRVGYQENGLGYPDHESRYGGRRGDGAQEEKRGRRWSDRLKYALSVGACSAFCVYIIGVGSELARGDREKRKDEARLRR